MKMIQPFYIFQFTEEDEQKITTAPDEPHQHDFEGLIIGIEGKIEHFIDFKITQLNASFVCFVTQGKVHRLIPRLKDSHCKWLVIYRVAR